MRWSAAVLGLVACTGTAPRPEPLAARRAPPALADAPLPTGLAPYALVELPPLPPRRGIDRAEEAACRAQYAYVQRRLGESYGFFDERRDDIHRLVLLARAAGGDCRIDTDELVARHASYYVGGCRGPTAQEALGGWALVAAVASTRGRRAAALRNRAALAYRLASYHADAARWIDVGDRFLAASRADPDVLELSWLAVDAYGHALRIDRIAPADVARIADRLEQIVDGPAADRARALRARLPR